MEARDRHLMDIMTGARFSAGPAKADGGRFDLLGSTPRVSEFEVLKFPEALLPGQIFVLRVERSDGGERLSFRLYEDSRSFASGRCRLAAARGETR
jgi:hypothetical protein